MTEKSFQELQLEVGGATQGYERRSGKGAVLLCKKTALVAMDFFNQGVVEP